MLAIDLAIGVIVIGRSALELVRGRNVGWALPTNKTYAEQQLRHVLSIDFTRFDLDGSVTLDRYLIHSIDRYCHRAIGNLNSTTALNWRSHSVP